MKVTVVAYPNARNPRIEQDLLGVLHVYVREPALEGKANRAVLTSLAEFFKTKANKIFLLMGETSKHKVFEIVE